MISKPLALQAANSPAQVKSKQNSKSTATPKPSAARAENPFQSQKAPAQTAKSNVSQTQKSTAPKAQNDLAGAANPSLQDLLVQLLALLSGSNSGANASLAPTGGNAKAATAVAPSTGSNGKAPALGPEPQSAAELANIKGLDKSPKLKGTVQKLANFAMDWKTNQSNNPNANQNDPQYQAGAAAYKLLLSAKQNGTVIQEGNLPKGVLGANEGGGKNITIRSGMSEDQTIQTLIHELGHNSDIAGVNVGDGDSKQEESFNNYLGDLVVNGMKGQSGKSLDYWTSVTAPLYNELGNTESGYLDRIKLALFA